MIRPLVAMPAPPAQPNGAPPQDAPVSFLDWVVTRGLGSAAQAGVATAPPGLSGNAPVPPAHGLPADLVDVRTGNDGLPIVPTLPVASINGLPAATVAPDAAGLALRIEHRTGPIELIALPWRLVASGGLAHVIGSRGADAADGHRMSMSVALATLSARNALAGGQSVPNGAVAGIGSDAPMALAASAPAFEVERFAAAEHTEASARADAPAALPWVARLLRWLDDHGEATLWVRDFRLDDSDKRALVATLRTAATQSGFRLDRIVINGRAHWHVHRPNRETPHAG